MPKIWRARPLDLPDDMSKQRKVQPPHPVAYLEFELGGCLLAR